MRIVLLLATIAGWGTMMTTKASFDEKRKVSSLALAIILLLLLDNGMESRVDAVIPGAQVSPNLEQDSSSDDVGVMLLRPNFQPGSTIRLPGSSGPVIVPGTPQGTSGTTQSKATHGQSVMHSAHFSGM